MNPVGGDAEVGNNDKFRFAIKEVCRGHASLRMVKRSSSAIGYSYDTDTSQKFRDCAIP